MRPAETHHGRARADLPGFCGIRRCRHCEKVIVILAQDADQSAPVSSHARFGIKIGVASYVVQLSVWVRNENDLRMPQTGLGEQATLIRHPDRTLNDIRGGGEENFLLPSRNIKRY